MMRTRERTRRVARWLACAAAAACCLIGTTAPAHANIEYLPSPKIAVPKAPSSPLLPGKPVTIEVQFSTGNAERTKYEWKPAIEMHLAFQAESNGEELLTRDDCGELVNVFLSGTGDDFSTETRYVDGRCNLYSYYFGEARHSLYSLDENGHVQVRFPMTYIHQVAAAFDDGTITELSVRFESIINGRCNGDPDIDSIDKASGIAGHYTWCSWSTRKGTTIPQDDSVLIEGDAEPILTDKFEATVGPLTDMTLPVNPFALPSPEDTASGEQAVESPGPGLLIGVGTLVGILLLIGGGSFVWALRTRN